MFLDLSKLIAYNTPALHYGVAGLDIDGDGVSEFFVAGFGCPNRILKWINGELVDLEEPILADPDRQAIGVAAGDLDGDGREELYVLNTDTYSGNKQFSDRLFHRHIDGSWEDLFSKSRNKGVRNMAAGRSVAAFDRRGTGRYSFVIANYGQPMRLYEMSPEERLIDLAPSLGLDQTTGGRGLWVGPLVSERMDLFCTNEHGPNFLFRNRGDGTFEEVAQECGLTDADEHGRGVTVLDANGDGRLDLCYGNWEGPHRLMLRQVNGIFRDQATPAMALPGAIRNVIAADFDNDGYEELFFNNIGESNRLFRTSPSREWRLADPGPAAEPYGLGTGAAVADLDQDGLLELLISHGEATPQPLSLFRCPRNANAWIRVHPRTRFGAPARGAVVRLIAAGREQIRVIDGGSGYLCQMEPVAHFGLGAVEAIERVTVVWPDGAKCTLLNPEPRRNHVIPYPTE